MIQTQETVYTTGYVYLEI